MSGYEKIYSVEIEGREYGFFLKKERKDVWRLIIPDCGGMADMLPRFSEQYDWLLPRIREISGIKEIWGTIWEIKGQECLDEVEKMFLTEGQISHKESVEFYYSNE